MSVSGKDVADLVNQGYIFGCAACKHLHSGLSLGLEGCGRTQCGSLLSAKHFDEYEGPLTDESWRNVCWVCGDEPVVGLKILSSDRIFSACEAHKEMHNEAFDDDEVIVLVEKRIDEKPNLIRELLRLQD